MVLQEGLVPTRDEALAGRVEFINVHFAYPMRPSNHVLRGLHFTAEPRKLTALCGPSGGGKSTVFSLMQRLYDPVCGEVLLDSFQTTQLQVCASLSHAPLDSAEMFVCVHQGHN
jgi:ABC-type multidrug transport system fused ATPase/permease subunit